MQEDKGHTCGGPSNRFESNSILNAQTEDGKIVKLFGSLRPR
jgi:hypothetical protein